jgi:RNA polymerase sigma-70 factor (ECF subfamily)
MDPDPIPTLVRHILNGRTDLFAELVGQFQTPIYNLALRMTGSAADAADLTQDTFVRAWIHLDKYDPRKKFFTWLYTLSLNLIRNHLRKRASCLAPAHEPAAVSLALDPAQALASRQEAGRIQQLLLRLPEDQREALWLRFFSDLSYSEMAAIMGVSPSGAKMRVSRGLRRLRVLVQDED